MKKDDTSAPSPARVSSSVLPEFDGPETDVDSGAQELDIELLLAMSEPVMPSSSLRAAIVAAAAGPWYEGFIRRTSALLDLPVDAGRALLAGIEDASRWMMGPGDGIELFHIEAGPALEGAITGFVRLAPGAAFPHHRHVGAEDVLVLSGSFVHEDGEAFVGQEVPMAPDSAHSIVAGAKGCVYLSVTREGMAFDDEEPIGPDDPRA